MWSMLTCREACCCAIVPMSSCACVNGQTSRAMEKVGAGSGTTKRWAARFCEHRDREFKAAAIDKPDFVCCFWMK